MPLQATPTVSVIMPTYNGLRFLGETLESFEQQTYAIDELIISDDESKDGTLEFASHFISKASFKVTVVKHRPNGVTANYLNALERATGDFIFVADQDDVWLPNKVELVIQAFQLEGVSLVCHDCLIVDSELNSLGATLRGDADRSTALSDVINAFDDIANLHRFLKGGLPLLAHSLAFKKEIKELVLDKPDSIGTWWFEEWLSCIALTQGRLHFVADQLVLYRQHDTQTSGGLQHSANVSSLPDEVVTKYASRIEKMQYCASLACGDSSVPRQSVFASYTAFLEQRDLSLARGLSIKSLLMSTGLLVRGQYHLYANGLMSFGLDMLTQLRSVKKT